MCYILLWIVYRFILYFFFIFHNICKIIKSKHQLRRFLVWKKKSKGFRFWITLFISTTTLILWFMEGGGRKSFIYCAYNTSDKDSICWNLKCWKFFTTKQQVCDKDCHEHKNVSTDFIIFQLLSNSECIIIN